MMTQDDIQEIKDLLNDESDKWRLDAGDWIGYVEELIDEIDRQRSIIDELKAAMLIRLSQHERLKSTGGKHDGHSGEA